MHSVRCMERSSAKLWVSYSCHVKPGSTASKPGCVSESNSLKACFAAYRQVTSTAQTRNQKSGARVCVHCERPHGRNPHPTESGLSYPLTGGNQSPTATPTPDGSPFSANSAS